MAIPSNVEPTKSLVVDTLENVFIAGHPQDYSSNYLSHLDTSTEIGAVADFFVGPGLNIVQGTALLPDEFVSEQLQSADLVHLSMPGVINLKYPEQSKLELSGDEDQLERATIGPTDIRQQPLSAKLVYLSTTRTQDHSRSNFSNQPALITDFQSAGAKAVIADLWGSNGRAAEALIMRFYNRLLQSKDISGSLRDAKLHYLRSQGHNGIYDWAGFQLFIE
jgi:CHAT domain-containing protein